MKTLFFTILLIFFNSSVWAIIKLPALVGDNMVLQRDAKIKLWGWADADEKVSVQFQNQQLLTKAGKDKKWMIVLSPLPAGGPYEMIIKGKNVITIKNIMIGDVWLASGQSNMEWPLNGINKSEIEISTSDYPQIRLFTVSKKFDFNPKEELQADGWKECSPEAVESFSAVAYLFARELYLYYKVPVGIIQAAWGGTPAEAWTSANGLKQFPDFTKTLEVFSRKDLTAYEAYKARRDAWNKKFGSIDRGRMANGRSWADLDISTDGWSQMQQPCPWFTISELKGYNGIIWFRKEIDVPADAAGKPIELSLGNIVITDSTFFNGELVGQTAGYEKKRHYIVPGNLVKAGKNLIAMRITGVPEQFGGIMNEPDEIYAQLGEQRITMAGKWLYKTGPDLSGIAEEVGFTDLRPDSPQAPAVLFNAMIAPLIPYSIKGAIWYQGESNADNMEEAKQYYSLFPAMIKDWRQQWGYAFPFLFVQLAGFKPDKGEPADYVWAHLREAQYKTLSLPNTGMATTIDIGDEKDIHPKNKLGVAHRLALAAQKVAYNNNVVYSGPTYKGMKVDGNKVRLSFDNVGTGVFVKDKYGYIRGFAVAGEDKKYVWAKAEQKGNNIIVYSESVNEPVAVRYNWGNTPDGNLYNNESLPAVPFRTDAW